MPRYKKDWWKKIRKNPSPDLFITFEELNKMLYRCHREDWKIALILLYYTGARPSELIELKMKNIRYERNAITDGNHLFDAIFIFLETKKGGEGRNIPIVITTENKHVLSILINYINKFSNLSEMRVLPNFKNKDQFKYMVWKVSEKKLCPYFFRHNRISQLAMSGASIYELMHWKGSKKPESVLPYLRLAGTETKKLALKVK